MSKATLATTAALIAGLVTTVLRDYEPERLPIHLGYPSRRLFSAKGSCGVGLLGG